MNTIGATGTATSSLQANSLNMQDFLNILMTQLTYQDPLKPMDNQAFMAQMAQFTNLGQTQELNSKIDSMLSTQASMQSIGLIGRTIQFNSASGAMSGTVQSLSWAGTTPELTVQVAGAGSMSGINLSQVTSVR